MTELREDKYDQLLQDALSNLQDVPAPDPQREALARQMFLSQAREIRREMAVTFSARQPRGLRRWLSGGQRGTPAFGYRMAAAVGVLVLMLGIASGGVAYASDSANPGDALYGIDTSVERAWLALSPSPSRQVVVYMSLARERLDEAWSLAREGDLDNLLLAIEAYRATVARLAQLTGSAGTGTLPAQFEQELLEQTQELDTLQGLVPRDLRNVIQNTIDSVRDTSDDDEDPDDSSGAGSSGSDDIEEPEETSEPPDSGESGSGDEEECLSSLTQEGISALVALAARYQRTYDEVLEIYCDRGSLSEVEDELIKDADDGPDDGDPPDGDAGDDDNSGSSDDDGDDDSSGSSGDDDGDDNSGSGGSSSGSSGGSDDDDDSDNSGSSEGSGSDSSGSSGDSDDDDDDLP